MSQRIPQSVHDEIVRLRKTGLSRKRIEKQVGCHWQTVKRVLSEANLLDNPFASTMLPSEDEIASPLQPSATPFTREESSDASRIEFTSDKQIRTLEDALAFAEVDTTVWRVDRWETTSWEVTLKLREFESSTLKVKSEHPVRKMMWRVKLYLKRILPKSLQDATEAIYKRMAEYSPKYEKKPLAILSREPHLYELSLYDLHLGKLAWAPETGGSDYDLKIAEKVFRHAVADLVNKAAGYEIEKFVLPIGNDFFHVDTQTSTTTAGTFVDADGRLAKIIEVGELAVIWAIEYLLSTAPVHVLWVPGNHDRMTSYHLVRTIAAWFRNHPDVTVDCSPKVRKYVHYHASLLGFTHGNEEKQSSLPVIMATEMPNEWAMSTTREFHIGHYHSSRKSETLPVATHDGVVVRTLRALSATDAWHSTRGYIGSMRAAEGYLFSKADGYAGHFVARARE